MYQGNTLSVAKIPNQAGLVKLTIDQPDSPVNAISEAMLEELKTVVELLEQPVSDVRGLLLCSGKRDFVVGADIFGFVPAFKKNQKQISAWIRSVQHLFDRFEALPFPKVCVIDGLALGGGLELALLADFRLGTPRSKLGFPEVSLGICPAWGGSVRASRLCGWQASLDWMITGKPQSAELALSVNALDAIFDENVINESAIKWVSEAIDGNKDWRTARARKQTPLSTEQASPTEINDSIETSSTRLDPRYPAAIEMMHALTSHLSLPFDTAQDIEAQLFAKLAKTDAAIALVGNFINDKNVNRIAREQAEGAKSVSRAAVLGAGIMGGGIAYQSALSGVPIIMKDIRDEALKLGMDTAAGALDKQVKRGKLNEAGKAQVLDRIEPKLDFEDFDQVDLVVEAVVENEKIKQTVLAETESKLSGDAILTSNTSTISIDALASNLARPEQFCGMHFFNPVPVMPLVEVIRGRLTSQETVNRTVAFALSLGKTPIVVNDCPGFLVNRVLFPYFNGFNRLLMDGVDFQRIDQVMETFGWPMGPAYLADVVGIDTMVHADQVLQEGFPQRMSHNQQPVMEQLLEQGRLGQKNGRGFYLYGKDESGRRTKTADPEVIAMIASRATQRIELSDEQIIDRLMIPMCTESVRCLDEGVVSSAAEVDMALLMGLGFPRFRGGALRYIESVGLETFANRCDANADQGELYQLTPEMRERVATGRNFY